MRCYARTDFPAVSGGVVFASQKNYHLRFCDVYNGIVVMCVQFSNSNVLIYVTGHGGEEFLKFQDTEVSGWFMSTDC